MHYYDSIETETGTFWVAVTQGGSVVGAGFSDPSLRGGDFAHDAFRCASATRQLREYFAGTRHEFDLPLHFSGTPFQQEVWRSLLEIPYGTTCSYGDIARRIGRPAAVRAVGAANGANRIGIIIPCHRVIGTNGKPVGYASGVPRKIHLLALERGERMLN